MKSSLEKYLMTSQAASLFSQLVSMVKPKLGVQLSAPLTVPSMVGSSATPQSKATGNWSVKTPASWEALPHTAKAPWANSARLLSTPWVSEPGSTEPSAYSLAADSMTGFQLEKSKTPLT